MPIFQWNPLFETGNPRIDQQHQRLFELTNELAAAVQNGERLPTLSALVSQLRGYAATHFCDEEQLMQCSALTHREKERHACAHRTFVARVDSLASRTDLTDTEAAGEFLEFLITWLVTHILKLDRRIAKSLVQQSNAAADKDVSPESLLIAALMETEHRFRILSDEAPSLIWIGGPSGEREYANKAWYDFVGIAGGAEPAVDWFSYIHPDDRDGYIKLIHRLIETGRGDSLELRVKLPSGKWGWILERISPRIHRDKCIGLIAAATDISYIKAAERLQAEANVRLEREVAERTRELNRLATADPLTGLANRRPLLERIDSEIARCARYGGSFSLLFIDIDKFKSINDTHGHAAGDIALRDVAGVIKGAVRKTDFVGRIGGEEFVVLLIKTSESHACHVAETICKAVERHHFDELPTAITVSIGVSAYKQGDLGDALLARADLAMLQAKHNGRNRYQLALRDEPISAPRKAALRAKAISG